MLAETSRYGFIGSKLDKNSTLKLISDKIPELSKVPTFGSLKRNGTNKKVF